MALLLIVDDDPVVRRSLIRALRPHVCVAAGNGRQALNSLFLHAFDLIISDVDMPVMSGVDFYMQARRDFPTVKLVFRTGSQSLGLGALGVPVFPKDWPMSTLIGAIDAYLGAGVTRPDAEVAQREAVSQVGGR